MADSAGKRELAERIGTRVAEVRLDRGLTQQALAEVVGLDPTTIHRVERGKAMPSIERFHQIAGALQVSLADLLGEVGDEIPRSPWTSPWAEACCVAVPMPG